MFNLLSAALVTQWLTYQQPIAVCRLCESSHPVGILNVYLKFEYLQIQTLL